LPKAMSRSSLPKAMSISRSEILREKEEEEGMSISRSEILRKKKKKKGPKLKKI